MYTLLIILHIVFALFLIVVVLLQSGKGAATANIFGGGGAENVFGAQTSVVLNKITTILAAGF
ncbi:MAG: preprotein translocase subunit SecG, partial [bacterium (Candidatus Ratteibacteria) CG15_BIG_FIL_POST_REV_8_21_14_020_41_12]